MHQQYAVMSKENTRFVNNSIVHKCRKQYFGFIHLQSASRHQIQEKWGTTGVFRGKQQKRNQKNMTYKKCWKDLCLSSLDSPGQKVFKIIKGCCQMEENYWFSNSIMYRRESIGLKMQQYDFWARHGEGNIWILIIIKHWISLFFIARF